MVSKLPHQQHYILLSISPPTQNVFKLRKTISNALEEMFGQTCAAMYIDVLWVEGKDEEGGGKCVVRVHKK